MPPQQIQQQQQQRPLINDWMEHYLGGDGFVNFGDFHDVVIFYLKNFFSKKYF